MHSTSGWPDPVQVTIALLWNEGLARSRWCIDSYAAHVHVALGLDIEGDRGAHRAETTAALRTVAGAGPGDPLQPFALEVKALQSTVVIFPMAPRRQRLVQLPVIRLDRDKAATRIIGAKDWTRRRGKGTGPHQRPSEDPRELHGEAHHLLHAEALAQDDRAHNDDEHVLHDDARKDEGNGRAVLDQGGMRHIGSEGQGATAEQEPTVFCERLPTRQGERLGNTHHRAQHPHEQQEDEQDHEHCGCHEHDIGEGVQPPSSGREGVALQREFQTLAEHRTPLQCETTR
mmetsp:Transcript_137052/g.292714  ORF Transcript_137052/g.292714 Transcript_137052/m.292714 type:complete len:287 (+) Transcript_137052:1-861(+)